MRTRIDRRSFLNRGLRAGAGAMALGASASVLARGPYSEDYCRAWRLAQPAPAVDEDSPDTFLFPRLRYTTLTNVNDRWDVHLGAEENLMAYMRGQTNIKVSNKIGAERCVPIDELDRANPMPFLFMTGEGNFRLDENQKRALREFFLRGGFLYADDCVVQDRGGDHDYFFQAFKREFGRLFPYTPMRPTPPSHEIYRCFYDIPGGRAPYGVGIRHQDMGLSINGRLAAFLTSGDVHCCWNGVPHLKHLQEDAFKMGINIVIYALTH